MSKNPTYFTKSFGAGKAQFKQTQINPEYTVAYTSVAVFIHLEKDSAVLYLERGNLGKGNEDPSARTYSPPLASPFSLMGVAPVQKVKQLRPHSVGQRENGRTQTSPLSSLLKA